MLVLAFGALLGQVPFGPLRFGAAGALFVGLAVGALDPRLGEGLVLVQTLGLALFVYTVGIAAGATFFSDLKRQAPLLGLGTVVLVVAAVVAVVVGKLFDLSPGMVAGAFAGSLTNTPALAAATAATGSTDAAVGYSIGYPVGVVFAILAVATIVGRRWPETSDTPSMASEGIHAITAVVERATSVREVPGWVDQNIKMSYLRRQGVTRVITPGEHLEDGDEVLVVGAPAHVDRAIEFLGRRAEADLTDQRAQVDFKRFTVSNSELYGRSVAEINIPDELGGVITRVRRGDLDLLADDDLVLEPGDRVLAVVPSSQMSRAIHFFGDSERSVSEIDALSTGIGMTLGLLLGLISVPLPGGGAFSLGSAAGPLVVGMILGALHRSGPLVWDLPQAANLTVRQIGLLLFLAAVGLANGPAFASQAFSATGAAVLAIGFAVVFASAVTFFGGARLMGLSAQRTAGAFAGYIGQPAILGYATSRTSDERVEAGYAALFALAIIVKILLVQVIVIL
ncbi:MAG TPA: TrkA C-terminal domain-containing protein [Actinomycetaceae bacterium]|nr:TrkA C-terminal domain-containing protein [Actinomycetaceae bacterium]